ncbi:hypothetical protein FEZ18_12720 [Oceanihabitans sp. IOP_32]|uniref:hypothetical protein n=1 Tax=Oceanihabitans sp. IOP_32 TaxID=2529032 RepID=UPI00129404E6|nr:hypothetical protein [Oceanihabitans sp. IOP_32]QFZ55604.1 hypothetical protein FEZ18_12720 [Oceanihabitans sp. IOP_32]
MHICMLSYSCSKEETTGQEKTVSNEDFYKPSGVITQEEAEILSNTWNLKNTSTLSKASRVKFEDDDLSFWWTIEDIRNYLDYSEQVAKENGNSLNGLRIYLGAYPNTGKTTLFMVPTVKKSSSKAGMVPFIFQEDVADCGECPPLNNGGGGGNGYPQ